MNRRFRITPKKILIVSAVLASLCLCFILYSFGNPRWYIHPPRDRPNTRWTCEELDFYFISDKHGSCYGELTLDGEKKTVYVFAGQRGHFLLEYAPTAHERSEELLRGWSSYKRYSFTAEVTEANPIIREALGGELPFTLHFTREDLDEEICFGGEGCVKCWDERGRN